MAETDQIRGEIDADVIVDVGVPGCYLGSVILNTTPLLNVPPY